MLYKLQKYYYRNKKKIIRYGLIIAVIIGLIYKLNTISFNKTEIINDIIEEMYNEKVYSELNITKDELENINKVMSETDKRNKNTLIKKYKNINILGNISKESDDFISDKDYKQYINIYIKYI